jgi:diguanylate cyclase (GGDEF)-like protein
VPLISQRSLVAITAAAQLVFPLGFWLVRDTFGPQIFVFALIPVGLAAWAFRARGGLAAVGVQLIAITALLAATTGAGWDVLIRSGQGPAAIELFLTAVSIAYLRRLSDTLRDQVAEAEALATAARVIAAGAVSHETLHGLVSAAMDVVPSCVASVVVPADDGQSLRVAAVLGATPEYLGRVYDAEQGVSGRAFRTGTIQRIDDVRDDPDYIAWTPAVRSALAVPIVRDGVTRGLLYFEDERPGRYSGRDERIMRAFADLAAVVLAAEEREQAFEQLALYDVLTGLPNRNLFAQRMADRLAVAGQHRQTVAVLLLDLDHFKDLNDTLGHRAGDLLLRVVAKRIEAQLPSGAIVARLGGDEFALMLETDARDALEIAERIRRSLELPFEVEGHAADVSGSIGISFFPEHGDSESTLLRHADVALYVAKSAGTGTAVYAEALDAHSPARLALTAELRQAIGAGELELQFQPIIALRAGQSDGVEALVRWRHPIRGLISPLEFIPAAERSGLIKPMTDWVVENALVAARDWSSAGTPVTVAINVSMRNLRDPKFVDRMAWHIGRHGLDPSRVWLELTESMAMTDPEQTRAALERLRATGVRIAIDDFGTGHSSLAYLSRLPVDALKIDRTFVADLTKDVASGSIVKAAVEVGHALGLVVVAEGVEDEGQLLALQALGADRAQGHFIARPMAADKVQPWLADRALDRRPGLVGPAPSRATGTAPEPVDPPNPGRASEQFEDQ